jgi:hypothetical protein
MILLVSNRFNGFDIKREFSLDEALIRLCKNKKHVLAAQRFLLMTGKFRKNTETLGTIKPKYVKITRIRK